MAVTSNSPGAYTAGTAIATVLRRFRDKGLTTPITADVLVRAGVSESLIPRTLQSLQVLELIDEMGQPTPTLLKMRAVPEADYKSTLAEWIQTVYAEVFAFADPRTDDPVRVRDAFRTFTPHGQQDRMVALFMTLCAEAGIVDSVKKSESKGAVRKPASVVRARANPAKVVPAIKGTPPPPNHHQTQGVNLPPALSGLLQSIPVSGGWSQESRDRFMSVFGSVLDFAVPVRPDPQPVADDDFDE